MVDEDMGDVGDGDDAGASATAAAGKTDGVSGGGSAKGGEGERNTTSELVRLRTRYV